MDREYCTRIAGEIVAQLGGFTQLQDRASVRNLRVSTTSRGVALTFDFTGPEMVNCCQVEYLRGPDYYAVRFYRVTQNAALVICIREDGEVYCDQLCTLFSDVTGIQLEAPTFGFAEVTEWPEA